MPCPPYIPAPSLSSISESTQGALLASCDEYQALIFIVLSVFSTYIPIANQICLYAAKLFCTKLMLVIMFYRDLNTRCYNQFHYLPFFNCFILPFQTWTFVYCIFEIHPFIAHSAYFGSVPSINIMPSYTCMACYIFRKITSLVDYFMIK